MSGIGYKGVIGAAQQTAFGTAVAATDRIPFKSEGLKDSPAFVEHDYICGGAGMKDLQNVFNPAGGSFEAVVPYTALDGTDLFGATLAIAAAFGTNAWDEINTVNKITFKDDLDTFLTLAIYKGIASKVWEFVGVFINSLTLSCSAGEALTASFDTIAGKLVSTGTTNTQTTLEGMECPDLELMTFDQMTCRIGDHSAALASADEVGISSFSLAINNNLSSDEQMTPQNTDHEDAKNQIQPVRNGFREVTLTIELPRYEADTFQDYKNNGDDLQADIVFTNGTKYFKILIPHLRVTDNDASVSDPAAIKQSVTLRCLAYIDTSDVVFEDAATDPGEVWIETKDDRTAAILS